MDCNEVEELLAPYALGALELPERERVEAHLATCPKCSLIYAEDRKIAALLSQSVPQEDPPASVRHRLLSRIDALTAGEEQQAEREPAYPHPPFSKIRRLLPVYIAVAVTVIAVVGAISTGFWFDHRLGQLAQENNRLAVSLAQESNRLAGMLSQETTHLSAMVNQLAQRNREQLYITYLSATPGVTVYLLKPTEAASKASGMMMVSSQGDYAILATLQLDTLPPDRVYQVWLLGDGQRDSGGFFKVDSSGAGLISIWPDKPILEYNEVGITIEPDGGSDWPTGEKVLGSGM